jgi:hypothetical protein
VSKGLELLDTAVGYALAGAALGTVQLLRRPTPCPGWDLETLLDHVSDSIGVLHEHPLRHHGRRRPVTLGRDPTPSRACAARQPGCCAPAPLPGQPSGGSPSVTAS